jgi:hypothetical protein
MKSTHMPISGLAYAVMKQSEWDAMPPKTRAAFAGMVDKAIETAKKKRQEAEIKAAMKGQG